MPVTGRLRLMMDHALVLLCVVTVGMAFKPVVVRSPTPAELIAYDCQLFYGPLGPKAERYCRIEMARQHGQMALFEAAVP